MSRALTECVVRCLRFDAERQSGFDGLGRFTKRDWRRALEWLDDSGLALHLLVSLRDAKAEDCLPLEVRARLERSSAANQARTKAMAEEFGILVRRFEESGVRYAVIKGFALIPEYCADGSLRHQMDHDFLVDPASIEHAQTALLAEGYTLRRATKSAGAILEQRFARAPTTWLAPNYDPYSLTEPRPVELHFKLWDAGENQPDVSGPDGALERRVVRAFKGIRFYALDDCDALAFQGLHVLRHMLIYWCRLSWLLEIARFLNERAKDDIFWTAYRKRLRRHPQLASVTDFIFSLATRLFGARDPARPWSSTPPDVASSLWIERYGETWALARFPGCKLSLLLLHKFWSRPTPAPEFVRQRLVPLRLPPALGSTSDTMGLGALKFLLARAMFHGAEFVRYSRQYPLWRLSLRRRLARAAMVAASKRSAQ